MTRSIGKGFCLTRLVPREADVLAACLELLRRHPKVAWVERFSVGAVKYENRYVRFAFPGCPDLMGMLKGGRYLAVEVKRPGGKLRVEQGAFLARVTDGGGVALCVSDARDLNDVLKNYG